MDRVFLDTTYILPLFGIDIRLDGYIEYFPVLHGFCELYYSPLSLIEAKWIIIGILRKMKDLDDKFKLMYEYRSGLDILLNDPRFKQSVLTNSLIEEIADRLWEAGVNDYFDRMIYAAASYYRAVLVTEDEEIHAIHRSANIVTKPKEVINWNKLVSRIKV